MVLMDSASASEWNFSGLRYLGPAQGNAWSACPCLKDFWFDWRNYHPSTSVYRH